MNAKMRLGAFMTNGTEDTLGGEPRQCSFIVLAGVGRANGTGCFAYIRSQLFRDSEAPDLFEIAVGGWLATVVVFPGVGPPCFPHMRKELFSVEVTGTRGERSLQTAF